MLAVFCFDGLLQAEDLRHATGLLCLQHAKKRFQDRCPGRYKQAVPLLMDMMAFLPPFPFHISMSTMLSELEASGQFAVVKHFKGGMRGRSQFSLITNSCGLLTAYGSHRSWRSRHFTMHFHVMQRNQIGASII